MASSKNNKSQNTPHKRYTTRQIMEFTEKRRKQMDEEARLELLAREKAAEIKSLQDPKFAQEIVTPPVQKEIPVLEPQMTRSVSEAKPSFAEEITKDQPVEQSAVSGQHHHLDIPDESLKEIKNSKANRPVLEHDTVEAFHDAIAKFTRQVIEHPARFDFPADSKVEQKTEETPAPTIENNDPQIPFVDGKAVAAMFREQPQNSSEQAVSDLIEREVDKVLTGFQPDGEFKAKVLVDIPANISSQSVKASEQSESPKTFASKFFAFVPVAMEWAFTISSILLIVTLFAHVLVSGWSRHYYELSSFVVLMAMSSLWLNRAQLQKRTDWFWGSAIIIAGGLGVFMAAAIEGRVYIELAGFVTVCFGIFLWRYTEESALRLFFPLVCMLFMMEPSVVWGEWTVDRLNMMVYSFSADILNSFHLPALFESHRFYVGPGVVDSQGDLTAFRTIAAAMPFAAICVAFQNMTAFWSGVLFASVIFWGVVGNIVRVTVTGLMLDNFGVPYATMFYQEYSVAIMMLVLVAGLTLTAGFLPHKEE